MTKKFHKEKYVGCIFIKTTIILVFLLVLSLLFFPPFLGTFSEQYGAKSVTVPSTNPSTDSRCTVLAYLGENILLDDLTKQTVRTDVQLPFTGFIQNLGQVPDESIHYYASSKGLSIGFGPSIITLVGAVQAETEPVRFEVRFPGAQTVVPLGRDKKGHSTNYFYGDQQFLNIPSWDEVWYPELYPGIDLRYYMSERGLKYDFVIQPGADPTQIALHISDAMALTIEEQTVAIQSREQSKCVYFQDTALQVFQADGTPVSARFMPIVACPNTYGFQVGSFDPTQVLVIDPVWLPFSTFLGGSNMDEGYAIAVDAVGNTYVSGMAENTFPTKNAYDDTFNGGWDAFITKINATGNGLIFSTYLGGNDLDWGNAIAVDIVGNSYITGNTQSNNFPMKNAYDNTLDGASDGYVTKLNATGNGLIFSTYLGGTLSENAKAIALDSYNNSYITGLTSSTDFPMKNAYNDTYGGGYDVFVTKLNAAGNGLVFSTYLGGNDTDKGEGIAVDTDNNTYITGVTESSNFPMINAYDDTYSGNNDVFVTKLNATGTGLNFSTYLGGLSVDYGYGIAVDTAGNSYITGRTLSSNFPTENAYDSTHNLEYDVFVTKLNATGNGLVFSTYIGGNDFEVGYGIALDTAGNSHIVGYTRSSNFPMVNAYNDTYGGNDDVFVAKLNATGNGLVASTYLGGNGTEYGLGIAVDIYGNSYVTGSTDSPNFPISNAYNNTYGGNRDAFVTKLFVDDTPPGIVLHSPANGTIHQSGTVIDLTITGANGSLIYHWDTTGNTTESDAFDPALPVGDGLHQLYIYVKDYAGNWNSTYLEFMTDDTGPTIFLNSPVNETVHSSGTTINLSISDPDLNTVRHKWDAMSWETFSTPYDTTLPTGDGSHTLYINATDEIGNWNLNVYVFTTDDTNPVITLTSPTNRTVHSSGITIDLSISDTHLETVMSKWDAMSWETFSAPYDTTLPMGDGSHTLYVNATDVAGNWVVHVYVFTTDDKNPTIILTSPANETVHPSGTTIDLSISDTHLDTVQYKWDTYSWEPFPAPYDVTLLSGDGPHTLYVNATDAAGNWVVHVYVFTTDDTDPVITLINPTNETIHQSGTTIDLSVTDINGVTQVLYIWDEDTNITLSSPYDVTLPEGDGAHTLYIYAKDTAGNWNTLMLIFTTDDTAPEATFSNFQNDKIVSGTYTIYFNPTDAGCGYHYAELWVEGVGLQTNTTGTSLIWGTTAVDAGVYTVIIKVYDQLGNTRDYRFTNIRIQTIIGPTTTGVIGFEPSFVIIVFIVSLILLSRVRRRRDGNQ